MTKKIIQRSLTITKDGKERVISEAELFTLGSPLVILGDPGMGKTYLMNNLANQLGTTRIPAGSFVRSAHPEKLLPPNGKPLVIDGLDELATSTGASAVDEVLRKLSALDLPPFVLSCRAADWQGSADRQKIADDYGTIPTTARLDPFTRADAMTYLAEWPIADADKLLETIDAQGLAEFYRNPLTLNLLAEVASSGQGLPQGRSDLLEKASELLCLEKNDIHARTTAGMAGVYALQDSAGAIFAHLLLAGLQGIADLPAAQVPDGFVAVGDLADIPDARLTPEATKTRLFQVAGEKLMIPYHRVIAEYLAARWLAKRLNAGLSSRRIEQALTFSGGVPTALRGLHAWFGHFAPRMTQRCIETDPYGFLRYGDPDQLSIPDARKLLQALITLANEDPYFRSEDWGKHSVGSIVRPELKSEILGLLKKPGRHVHLTTLILESLPQSKLVGDIAPDLRALVVDETAPFVERDNAAEALISAKIPVNWPKIVKRLNASEQDDSRRLGLETIGNADPNRFDPEDIGQALITNHNLFGPRGGTHHVHGSDYRLTRQLNPVTAGEVLDRLVFHVAKNRPNPYWEMRYSAAATTLRLIRKALEVPVPDIERLWKWLKLIPSGHGLHDADRQFLSDFLRADLVRKHALQAIAFADNSIHGTPFVAVVSALPRASSALRVTEDDAIHFANEITAKDELSNFDIELWAALVRSQRGEDGVLDPVRSIALRSVAKHAVLKSSWDEYEGPVPDDWRKQEAARSAKAERSKQRRYQTQRKRFAMHKDDISAGKSLGCLNDFAKAYLNQYWDLDHVGSGSQRLQEWLGEDLADAALEGLVKALDRADLPSAQQIAETHAEGKTWNSEAVMISGIAELVRKGNGLGGVRPEMLKAALAAWWETPDSFNEEVGTDVQPQLEAAVFTSQAATEDFLRTTMEPAITAGHDRVPGLYQLPRDPRYHGIAGTLALDWLRRFPDAKPSVQRELILVAERFGQRAGVRELAEQRVKTQIADNELRSIWMGALFVTAFDSNVGQLKAFAREAPESLWVFAGASRAERGEGWHALSLEQVEFIFTEFAPRWAATGRPTGVSSGSKNSWDASDYLGNLINILGANSSKEASDALDRLSNNKAVESYLDHIKHVRAQQLKLRRETTYQVPTFQQIKSTLKGAAPECIDDVKAVTLDALEIVQKYLRDGDTRAWSKYAPDGRPLTENDCRDRLLEDMRPNLPAPLLATPEITMPDRKRADIAVMMRGLGLPMEIKGQWHPEVWTAPSNQLIERYTRDFRANGRGIYLVLWFGKNKSKPLTTDPNNPTPPASPSEMRDRLVCMLPKEEQSRVAVVVLDVSTPKPTGKSKPKPSSKSKTKRRPSAKAKPQRH